MEERHLGQFEVDLEFLRRALHLPSDAKLVGVAAPLKEQIFLRTISLIVEHPDLPACSENCFPVSIKPIFDEIGLVKWGMPKPEEGE